MTDLVRIDTNAVMEIASRSFVAMQPHGLASEREIAAAVANLIKEAQDACPAIESRLKYLADLHQGQMIGLEWKIKPAASLLRKMTLSMDRVVSLSQLVEQQYDVLRFTMLLPTSRYVTGVETVIKTLVDCEGTRPLEVKNYWDCYTYKGINCIFQATGGGKFELQFHTPQSWDNKQNQTHVLYETLRKEQDPVKQNLFFLDMRSMWDAIDIPEGVNRIGQTRKQDLPKPPASLSEEEDAMIRRTWSIKESILNEIALLRRWTFIADSHGLLKCLQYAISLHPGAQLTDLDSRFRSSLLLRRRVEESLRRHLGCAVSQHLHEAVLPTTVDGQPIQSLVKRLAWDTYDVLHYIVVVDPEAAMSPSASIPSGGTVADRVVATVFPQDSSALNVTAACSRGAHPTYTSCVLGVLDVLNRNGYPTLTVQNYWFDVEKHHAIRAVFTANRSLVDDDAANGVKRSSPLPTTSWYLSELFGDGDGGDDPGACLGGLIRFSIEFHTRASYSAKLERKTVLAHTEKMLYQRGEPVIKAAIDMQVRYDTVLLRRWRSVPIPDGVADIGHFATGAPLGIDGAIGGESEGALHPTAGGPLSGGVASSVASSSPPQPSSMSGSGVVVAASIIGRLFGIHRAQRHVSTVGGGDDPNTLPPWPTPTQLRRRQLMRHMIVTVAIVSGWLASTTAAPLLSLLWVRLRHRSVIAMGATARLCRLVECVFAVLALAYARKLYRIALEW